MADVLTSPPPAPAAEAQGPATRRPRAFWWRVHGWAGLKLSLLLTFVLATGTLAVVAHEIDWLATPALRVAPRDAPPASWGALATSASAAAPGRLQELYAPVEPGFAAEAWIAQPKKRIERVYLDPYTARVTGTHGWANAHRFLRDVHRHLMLPLAWGVPIVSSTALFLLASLVSGLVTYKKWWRGYGRPPSAKEPRRFAGELHRFAAVWSLPALPVVIVTGLYYGVQSFGLEAPPLPRPPTPVAAPKPPKGAALDAMVARAVAASPGLSVTEVRFPPKAKGYGVQVMGQASAVLVRDRANAVWLDPKTGAVRLVGRGERLPAFSRIDEAADPLHFGVWGGWPSKALWFVAGLALTTLAASGVAVFSLRLHRAEDAPAAARPRGPLARGWAGMGPWRYAAVALILLSLVLAPGVLMEH